jgi:hypothetical protein
MLKYSARQWYENASRALDTDGSDAKGQHKTLGPLIQLKPLLNFHTLWAEIVLSQYGKYGISMTILKKTQHSGQLFKIEPIYKYIVENPEMCTV